MLTLFGVLDIPLIFFAVKLWRGIHPNVLGQENNMPGDMKFTLIFTNITILYFFAVLFWMKQKALRVEDALRARLT